MVFKKDSVGASLGKASFTRGVNHLIKKHAIIHRSITMKKSPWVYVVLFERNRSWLYVCNMLKVYYKYIKVLIPVYSGIRMLYETVY